MLTDSIQLSLDGFFILLIFVYSTEMIGLVVWLKFVREG